ncbi:aldehyde dehydrogenase family protein [Saccharopolyspora rosea]|uniref:Aldehyde dehydrogenase family protein n=1 Tax=Saccharopolyspora rosea TaxID=524884 RepID=A0ABW3FVY1_9PSEU
MDAHSMYIAGEPVGAADGATFTSYEPATGRVLAELPRGGPAEVDRALAAARRAFDDGPWPRMSGAERAALLDAVAARLGEHADRLARWEVRDGGTTVRKARALDLPAARAAFEWSAWWARELADTDTDGAGTHLRRHPVGVVAEIVPWNFPLLLAAWRMAPALAAGNTCVVKPASFTSVTACELVRLVHEAGIPPGVVNLVLGPGGVVGEQLVGDARVDLASFTGSNEVGEQVALAAARRGTRARLALGGKSANLVLADADLDRAVSGVLWSIYLHNGQVCTAGSRALVHRGLLPDFLALLREKAAGLALGDPLDPATDLGPLVSRQQVRTVARHVRTSLERGAGLLWGGCRPDPAELPPDLDAKAYYRPTAILDEDGRNPVSREEIFGPVLAVTPVESDEHALALANDSHYRLAGAVWSTDAERAWQVADRVRAETVWVNEYRTVDVTGPDPGRVPSRWDAFANDLDTYRTTRRVRVWPADHDNPHREVLGG